MTREEAISLLKLAKAEIEWEYPLDYQLALDKAIKASEQEPCEDCISRQAVLSKIKEVCFSEEWAQFRVDNGSNGQRDFLINYIEQLSPVTPQPKIGHWIMHDYHRECSECKVYLPKHMTRNSYCPNCGAKMESEG